MRGSVSADARALYYSGWILLTEKQSFESARQAFDRVISLESKVPEAYVLRADLAESRGNTAQANSDRATARALGAQDSKKRLYPQTPFDLANARAALAPGTGTITGVALSDKADRRFKAAGVEIRLCRLTLPRSPHEASVSKRKRSNRLLHNGTPSSAARAYFHESSICCAVRISRVRYSLPRRGLRRFFAPPAR